VPEDSAVHTLHETVSIYICAALVDAVSTRVHDSKIAASIKIERLANLGEAQVESRWLEIQLFRRSEGGDLSVLAFYKQCVLGIEGVALDFPAHQAKIFVRGTLKTERALRRNRRV